jgi:hypothetical protein
MKIIFDPKEKIEDEDVELFDMSATYIQNGDCCSDLTTHELKIKTENNGTSNFLVFSTERWAVDIDRLDEITEILKDFVRRLK